MLHSTISHFKKNGSLASPSSKFKLPKKAKKLAPFEQQHKSKPKFYLMTINNKARMLACD